MSEYEQIALKKQCNTDAKYKKNWRELEDRLGRHSNTVKDFSLGEKGWQSDKTTVWWED